MRTRWRCLRVLADPVRVEESLTFDVPRSAAEVWDFMWDPASLLIIEPDVTAAMTLPGTPEGRVGEIQAVVHTSGASRSLVAQEVVALEPGRIAMTRTLTESLDSGARLEVEPLGDHACRLTQSFHTVLTPGMERAAVEVMRDLHRQALAELERRVLAHFSR